MGYIHGGEDHHPQHFTLEKDYSVGIKAFESMNLILVFVIIISFFFIAHQAGGQQSLEVELKTLNKPAIKSISTDDGDTFDCVNIYEQPTFDHPLLRNHTLQMKPSFVPEGLVNESLLEENYPQFGLEGGGCPEGSVPIRRIRKEDLIRVREYFEKNPTAINPNTEDKPGWHFAMSITGKVGIPFRGGRGLINVYNFNVTKEQHSDSVVYVSRDLFQQQNSIYAGWSVFPAIYGDSLTRFHTTWTADGNLKTGCVDILCPGFVQVNKMIPLGIPIKPISQYRGQQYRYPISIFQDQYSGNWWLVASTSIMVGYWPKEIFTGMQGYADEVGWGGRVYSPVPDLSPPMGSGRFPDAGLGEACFLMEMQFVRSGQGYFEDVNQNQLISKADNPSCYNLHIFLYSHTPCNIFFGGPGGACGSFV